MARPRSAARDAAPPAIRPSERTVGQLVAETLGIYGRRFLPSLALGVGPAALLVVTAGAEPAVRLLVGSTFGALVFGASFVAASVIVHGRAPSGALARALALAVLVFVPFPLLARAFVLPALAWLALVGLAVPVLVAERTTVAAAVRRALRLARADFVHLLGGLATLWLLVLVTQVALVFVLREQGDQTVQAASVLATLVLTPVFFLGAALLYEDQTARIDSGSRKTRRRRGDADVHPADDADRPGRPDAEVEPRAAARGQP